MEPLHLSADGCLLVSQTIRVTLLHTDPAHRSLDWSAQHEEKLPPEGELKCIPASESFHSLFSPENTICFFVFQIIWSLLLPPAILVLEFKSKAEMCHVPQSHEAMLFGLDTAKSVPAHEETDHTVKLQ